MASYELMFIIKPELDEEQVTTATDRVHQLIVANGGTVTKTAAWGKRRLAYRVGPYREGYYVVSNFDVESARIAELERVLKISDTVFRHLLVRRDTPAIGQTEVVVPEATPEELAAMYEPILTEDEADEAPPAVTEEDVEAIPAAQSTEAAETGGMEPDGAEGGDETKSEAAVELPAVPEPRDQTEPEAASAAGHEKETGHEPQ